VTPSEPDPDNAPEGVLGERPRRSARRTALSAGLVLVLVAAFGYSLAGKWDEVFTRMREQNPWILLGSFALCLLAVLMSFLLWRGTLAALGSDVPARGVARMFFVAQLGKYLPGSVWPVVAQMRMGREIGLPRQRVALAFLLTLGLSVLWGLVVGLLALPALLQQEGPGLAVTVVLAVPLVLVLLIPRVLNALLARALRLLRRPGLDRPLTGRDLVRGSIWTLAFWAVFGGHVWLLAVGLDAEPWHTLPVAIGGFAIAFSIGPLLVVLPAGAGVREAVLVLLLATVLSSTDATAVALTSRGLLMATDGVLALAGWLFPHRVLASLTSSDAER
jgi:glycosyltransferase 2 family protein